MKKIVCGTIILMIILLACVFLAGCLDYKQYQAPAEGNASEEDQLISEIAEIEKSIEKEKQETKAVEEEIGKVEEEVVLPEIKDKSAEDETLQILNVKENDLVKLKVTITDPDKDTINYTFSQPLNSKGEWKTNYGDAGDYVVTITATDNKLTTEKKVKISVQRVNVPPLIEGIGDLFVKEGDAVKLDLKVTDPNKDPVTYTVSEPLASGIWATDHKSAGEYSIKVVASDGELQTEKPFKLTVTDLNVPPDVSGLEDLNVKEGETVKIQPKVTDLDEDDKVTLTISEPVGDEGIWETSYTDHGEYTITVTATDGKDKVVKKVRVNVADVNMPPVIGEIGVAVN